MALVESAENIQLDLGKQSRYTVVTDPEFQSAS